MNNPMKYINVVVSEPCLSPGGFSFGSWGVAHKCISRSSNPLDQEAIWRSVLLPQARETSVYLLGEKVYAQPSRDHSLRTRIEEIGALGADWDGDGAPAIDPLIVQSTLRVLDALPSSLQVEASPNTNGTISLYLSTDTRYAELEIGLTRYGWTSFRNTNRQATATRSGNVEEIPLGDGFVSLLAELHEEAAALLKVPTPPLPVIREERMAGGGVRFNAPGLPALAAR